MFYSILLNYNYNRPEEICLSASPAIHNIVIRLVNHVLCAHLSLFWSSLIIVQNIISQIGRYIILKYRLLVIQSSYRTGVYDGAMCLCYYLYSRGCDALFIDWKHKLL